MRQLFSIGVSAQQLGHIWPGRGAHMGAQLAGHLDHVKFSVPVDTLICGVVSDTGL